jgi:serine/threonine-protein kinase
VSPGLSPSSPAATDTGEPSASATSAGVPDTTPPGDTESPPAPTTSAPSAPAATAVKDVTVSAFRQTGLSTATSTIAITTDGTGPVSVTVSWFKGDNSGQLGSPDGASETFQRAGATQYTITVDHTFGRGGCYWAVQGTTSPASADGGASQQLLTRQCEIR